MRQVYNKSSVKESMDHDGIPADSDENISGKDRRKKSQWTAEGVVQCKNPPVTDQGIFADRFISGKLTLTFSF